MTTTETQVNTKKTAPPPVAPQPQKAVATAPKGELMADNLPTEIAGSWGAEEATADDIIIPKLLLMHGQSTLVLEGKKSQGELIRSTDQVTLGGRDKTVTIIPFKMFKTWRVSEYVGAKAEWRRDEPYDTTNMDLPWEFEETNKTGQVAKMRRDKAYNFYAMIASDITEAGETPFPLKVQFLRTSSRAGKLLADHFSKCKMYNKPPALQTFDIGTEFVNGDKQKYFIFTAKPGKATTMEQLKVCKNWYDLITKSAASIKDHEAEDVTETASTKAEF
jgi:hypothetical protein